MLKRIFVFAFVLLMAASACMAQSTPSPVTLRFPDRGFSSYTSLSQSYDSSANWTSIVDSTVSYNFNKVFGISVGAPFYLASLLLLSAAVVAVVVTRDSAASAE